MNPLNKIMLGIGAAIALVIVITFVWLTIANARLKTELAESQANATACHMANDEFAGKIAIQNKAVEKMRQDGLQREKHAQQLAYEAQQTVRRTYIAAEKVKKIKTTGDSCATAQTLFNAYLESAK